MSASDGPARPAVRLSRRLEISECPAGVTTRLLVELADDGLGQPIRVPVLVARGRRAGPVFGMTAAVHGDELNGIRVIHDLFAHLDVRTLRGTVVAAVAVNVPGLHWHIRDFVDGRDLNHIFPGVPDGRVADVWAYRVIERIVRHLDYLADLHTASLGRTNCVYVRADMSDRRTARMAYLQRPQIIVHSPPHDGTLRGAAMELGIPAITVEIGDPMRFQPGHVRSCRVGLRALLVDLGMVPKRPAALLQEPVLCSGSRWLYTDKGGLLEVLPRPLDSVAKGDAVARLQDAFGDVVRTYHAPADGVVIGCSLNPVGQTGARILHLGFPAAPDHGLVRRYSIGGASTGTLRALAEELAGSPASPAEPPGEAEGAQPPSEGLS